ncbi:MAG: family N-acetyltransferase [Humibacillus sp.]|nr:family N-acetyltransferase [Humibacillus sp.]
MHWTTRAARSDDLAGLPSIEAAADALFADHGLGPLPPGVSSARDLSRAAYVLVAGDPVVGFARLEVVDGQPHLEQLSVRPDSGRKGVGRSLLHAAVAWASANGYATVTLCTFAHVPWNAPFYSRNGFEVTSDLGPELAALVHVERQVGLHAVGRRVVMRRPIPPAKGER